MTNEEFTIEVENSCNRSKKLLVKKGEEYSGPSDRLINFKRSAAIQGINSIQAAVGFMTKHYDSICQMSKNPSAFSEKQWNEKLTDLRNYSILIDALLRDEVF
jgi:hypothetical protein